MRRSLFYLVLLSVGWIGVGATEAQAQQKNFFLKITSPEDLQRWGPGATCTVTGFLQLPEPTSDIGSLYLRVRVYGHRKQEFIIMGNTECPEP